MLSFDTRVATREEEIVNAYVDRDRRQLELLQQLGTIDTTASLGLPVEQLPPTPVMAKRAIALWSQRLEPFIELYQRSADLFLGVPFNIASYALLTVMLADVTGLQPGEFVHTFGDAHLYLDHLEQAREQIGREPRPLPTLAILRHPESIFDFRYEDFELRDYDPHPHIKAAVSV